MLELVRRERGEAADPSDMDLIVNAALIGWLTLGISVWQAGRHVPTADYGDRSLEDSVRQRIRELIINAAQLP